MLSGSSSLPFLDPKRLPWLITTAVLLGILGYYIFAR